ncbi:MAG: addiction module protein [Verrucomicrobiota bacterium]
MTVVAEQIEALTTVEKLEAMEVIWESLSKNCADLPIPEWHDVILKERRELVEKGDAEYTDWAEAKKQILDRVL